MPCDHDAAASGTLYLRNGRAIAAVECEDCGEVLKSWDVEAYDPAPASAIQPKVPA